MDYSEIRDPCANCGCHFDISESEALDLEVRGFVEKDFQLEPFDVEKHLEEIRGGFAADQAAREEWAAKKRPEGSLDEQSEFFKKREGMIQVARGVFMKSINVSSLQEKNQFSSYFFCYNNFNFVFQE